MEPKVYVEIDLRQIFAIIRKHLWIIVSLTVATTLVTGLVSYFYIKPAYEASTQLLVNKSEKKEDLLFSLNDINAVLKLTETYSVIIKSPRIMDLVIAQYGMQTTEEELTKKVEVTPVKNSQVISITVTDGSQEQAAKLANGIAEVFKKEIVSIMNVDNVQILTVAKVDPEPVPVKPKPLLNTIISFVVGMMTGVGIAFLLEYLDTSIKNEQEVENILGLPVLGSIPIMNVQKKKEAKLAGPNMLTPAHVEVAVGSEPSDEKK